ncbi:ABC transporter ATP-binding protein [Paucilactobacillus wasatchensis]|uniref:ABC-type quaternary amine transporter n=1 Tax=Paucilactobacillus wasatchensis TaxID=1335616 RepID=A0A0D0Y3U1_9LACO|nr:ABC transporter ATP-binding protein [Paucilactobacillus wasatchensis]KIS02923.1 L-proline glycine betaine ABC transport system permease protein ProV [Paucilactobacillus wasatchensis]
MTEALLKFDHVGKTFADKKVIDDFNLEVKQGELLVLVGVSGSGKTTTLKMINQLERPTDGDIYYHGKQIKDYNVQELRWNIGYVLQQIALFPTMTVAQNIRVIPEMKKMPKREIDTTVRQLLTSVDLDPAKYAKRMPRELSGGEQQRVGILRALASKPDVVLMDEPFSALDPISRTSLQDLVLRLHAKLKNTIVFVTHDMGEALKMGDQIAIMSNGKLIQVDAPDQIAQHPANDFVASFFASARAKNIYDIYLGRIGMDGYYQNETVTQNLSVLDEEATVRAGLHELVTHEVLQINEHGTKQLKGYLDRTAIIQYLSEHEHA